MSEEYIKMWDAVAMCENSKTLGHAIHKIMCMPSADVAPVRHGRWEDYEENTWQCSECGELFYLEDGTPQENEYRYCPNCGAKMDEEKEDEL